MKPAAFACCGLHTLRPCRFSSYAIVTATGTPSPRPWARNAIPTSAEPLADRLWRQVRDGIDKDRLLPSFDKRRGQVLKQLDRLLNANGRARFVAAQAHTIANGKAPARRNAERMLVETVARWLADVTELAPERLPALREIVDYSLRHPAALVKADRW